MAQSDQLMRMGFARITIRTICRRCFAMRRGGGPAGGARPLPGRARDHTLHWPADGFPNPMRGQCGHPTVRPVVTTDVKAVFGILRTKMYEKVYLLYIIYKKVLRVWHKYDKIKSKIMSSHICFPKNLFLP